MAQVEMASPAAQAAIWALISRDPRVTAEVKARAVQVRDEARRRAGAGGEHIIVARHYNQSTRQVTQRVGWRSQHFFMGFKELGTVHQPAVGFLRGAADMFGARRNAGRLDGVDGI